MAGARRERPARAAGAADGETPKQPTPALLPAAAVRNTLDTAAELATLLGLDARCVMAAIGLTAGGEGDASADAADEPL